MMSAKIATRGILKIKLFWIKSYDIIISAYDVINIIWSCDSNYVVDVVMWPKFGNSSSSMGEVIFNLNFVRIWPEKPLFWGVVLVQVQ